MLTIKYCLLISIILALSGCSDEPDNTLPSNSSDSALESRIDELERDSAADSANARHQEKGNRLTLQTVGEANAYLKELYANINETREQDLPEWQDMYTAMTNKEAMEDPNYGLGPRKLETNFHRLQVSASENTSEIGTLSTKLEANSVVDKQQNESLQLVLSRLATIDSNIKELNKTVNDKFKQVDKKLSDFDGRIVGIENRMKTVEIDLDSFRSEFVEYKQRVTNIENILRRYDLAVMHGDIKNLKEIASNHDERLIDLFGKVQINTSEIAINRNNLTEAEQEISGLSSEVGTLKVGVGEIFDRLDSCPCFQMTKEL